MVYILYGIGEPPPYSKRWAEPWIRSHLRPKTASHLTHTLMRSRLPKALYWVVLAIFVHESYTVQTMEARCCLVRPILAFISSDHHKTPAFNMWNTTTTDNYHDGQATGGPLLLWTDFWRNVGEFLFVKCLTQQPPQGFTSK